MNQASNVLTVGQKEQLAKLMQKQVAQIQNRAYYYAYALSNKWLELSIRQIPKQDFQKLLDFIKEQHSSLKNTKYSLTVEFAKQYHKFGVIYLTNLTTKAEQIIRKAAQNNSSVSTARAVQTLRNNMKTMIESLNLVYKDFDLIERTFFPPIIEPLNNSRHSNQSQQSFDHSQTMNGSYSNYSINRLNGYHKISVPSGKTDAFKPVSTYGVETGPYLNTIQSSNNQRKQILNAIDTSATFNSSFYAVQPSTTVNQTNFKANNQPKTIQTTTTTTSNRKSVPKPTENQFSLPTSLNLFKKDPPSNHYAVNSSSKREEPIENGHSLRQKKSRQEYESIIREKDALLAQKQRICLSLKTQIQTKDTSLQTHQQKINHLQQTYTRQSNIKQTQRRKLLQQSNQLKEQLRKFKQNSQTQNKQFKPIQQKLYKAKDEFAKLIDEIKQVKNNVEDAKKQESKQKQLIEHNSHQVKAKMQQVERLSGDVMKLNKYIENDANKKINQLIDELNAIAKEGSSFLSSQNNKPRNYGMSLQEELTSNLTNIKSQIVHLKTIFTEANTKVTTKNQQLIKIQQKVSQSSKKLTNLEQQITKAQTQLNEVKLNDGTVKSYEKLKEQEKSLQKDIKQLKADYIEKKEGYDEKIDKIQQKVKQAQMQLDKIQQEYVLKTEEHNNLLKAEEQRLQQRFSLVKSQLDQALKQTLGQALSLQKLHTQLDMLYNENQYLKSLLTQKLESSPTILPSQTHSSPQSHPNLTEIHHLKDQLQKLHQITEAEMQEKQQLKTNLMLLEEQIQQYQAQQAYSEQKLKQYEQKSSEYEKAIIQQNSLIEQLKLTKELPSVAKNGSSTHMIQTHEKLSPSNSTDRSSLTPSFQSDSHLKENDFKPGFRMIPSQDIEKSSAPEQDCHQIDERPTIAIKHQEIQCDRFNFTQEPLSLPIYTENNRGYLPHPNIQELFDERESLIQSLNMLQKTTKMKENELNLLRMPLTNQSSDRNASFIQIDSEKIQLLQKQLKQYVSALQMDEKRLRQIEEIHIKAKNTSFSSHRR